MPSAFVWRGKVHSVTEVVWEWLDFGRRGRVGEDMQPEHLRSVRRFGSWGVGRFYFRVRVEDGRVFDLYYDRAPKDAADRQGHWYLWRELKPSEAGRHP